MRVIAGLARGRPLLAPPGRGTRPTADRLKQALFNILGDAVPDAVVLDLYAGSGALGIEALSRGARAATFVEKDPRAARVLRTNLGRCGFAEQARIIVAEADAALRRLAAAARAASATNAASPAAAGSPEAGEATPPHAAIPTTAGAPETGAATPPAAGAPDIVAVTPPWAAIPWPGPAGAPDTVAAAPPRAAMPAAAGAPDTVAPAPPPPGEPARFTLVLADPPYSTGAAARTLALLAGEGAAALAPSALIAVEHAPGEEMPDVAGNLRLIRRRAQGRGCVSVYGFAAPQAGASAG